MSMKYIEKKSIVPLPQANGTISDTTNITDKITNTYSARVIEEDLIETITNENGTAIKFPDGTMICMNTVDLVDIPINNSTGGMYRSVEKTLNDYAVPFIEKPKSVQMYLEQSLTSNTLIGICNGKILGTSQTPPSIMLWASAGVNAQTIPYILNYTAIGKWK